MSFTTITKSLLCNLPTELLTSIYDCLTCPELLFSASHLCRFFASSLSPASFRKHPQIDDRFVIQIPHLSSPSVALLSSATSLSLSYGESCPEADLDQLFNSRCPRSLLIFSCITSMSLEYADPWVSAGIPTPLDRFLQLLSSHNAKAFALLQSLTVFWVDFETPYNWPISPLRPFTPLLHISSLVSIKLEMEFWQSRLPDTLLQLPALKVLDLRGCWWILK